MAASNPSTTHGPWGVLAPVLFVLFWSTGFISTKLGLNHAEPYTFLAVRYAITAALVAPFAWAVRAPWPRSWAEAAHLAVAGALFNGIYLGAVFSAINHGVAIAVVALIVGMQPILTGAVVGRLLGETVTLRQWLGLLLGFAGVALVLWERLGTSQASPLGFGFAVLCLFAITAAVLYQKRYCAEMDLRTGLVIQQLSGAAVTGAVAVMFETMNVAWTGEFMFAIGWLIIVLTFGAFTLLYFMIRRGAAARVTSLFYLVPPGAAVLAFFAFGEMLGWVAITGIVVAVIGVALVNR